MLSNALFKKGTTQGSAMDAGLLASHQGEEPLALTIPTTTFPFCQGLIDHQQGERLCQKEYSVISSGAFIILPGTFLQDMFL